MWLVEEIGELAAALREGTPQELAAEFADVLAWLTTIAKRRRGRPDPVQSKKNMARAVPVVDDFAAPATMRKSRDTTDQSTCAERS